MSKEQKRSGAEKERNERLVREKKDSKVVEKRWNDGRVFDLEDFHYLPKEITRLTVGCETCNATEVNKELNTYYKSIKSAPNTWNNSLFDVSVFQELESITIEDSCLRKINGFTVSGLKKLKKLSVGSNCCCICETTPTTARAVTLRISDCGCLESIVIGPKSFSDWGRLYIGSEDEKGWLWLDLAQLTELKMGAECFNRCYDAVFESNE